MTSAQLKAQIDTEVTNKSANNSVSPTNVGGNLKDVVDYVDRQAPETTYGVVNSTGTLTTLTNKVNDLTGENGLFKLPETNTVPLGTVIYVIGNANIPAVIRGNTANQTIIKSPNINDTKSSVTINRFQKAKFSKLENNYWYYETMDSVDCLTYRAILTKSGAVFTLNILKNELAETLMANNSGTNCVINSVSSNNFLTDKTVIRISDTSYLNTVVTKFSKDSNNQITIYTYYNGSDNINFTNNIDVELLVYPN